ncbi:MAG TPA: PilX N-terminal domain-containing pilus assembly protein [Steroidobacteraceae bacterium]
MSRPSSSVHDFRGERGMALITGLLVLLVVTIIAVGMFTGFGTEEQIAGNSREKQRSYNAAVSAEQYAEWLLTSGLAPQSTTCAAGAVSSDSPEICNATATPTDFTTLALPWATRNTYTPFSSTQTLAKTGASQGSYYDAPAFYITYLGNSVAQGGDLYQIDAYGYGGTSNSVSIVESTYVVKNNVGTRSLDPASAGH